MDPQIVSCGKCKTPLAETVFNLEDLTPCPGCGSRLQAQVFPALFRRFTPGRSGEAVMEESEASCFYHPQKKAVLPC
ncbi:MAG: hypothetical protein JWR69_2593, partial [Pedosphaera sp.]|nr:hypothetical protein [Pedosphaera sp.]